MTVESYIRQYFIPSAGSQDIINDCMCCYCTVRYERCYLGEVVKGEKESQLFATIASKNSERFTCPESTPSLPDAFEPTPYEYHSASDLYTHPLLQEFR